MRAVGNWVMAMTATAVLAIGGCSPPAPTAAPAPGGGTAGTGSGQASAPAAPRSPSGLQSQEQYPELRLGTTGGAPAGTAADAPPSDVPPSDAPPPASGEAFAGGAPSAPAAPTEPGLLPRNGFMPYLDSSFVLTRINPGRDGGGFVPQLDMAAATSSAAPPAFGAGGQAGFGAGGQVQGGDDLEMAGGGGAAEGAFEGPPAGGMATGPGGALPPAGGGDFDGDLEGSGFGETGGAGLAMPGLPGAGGQPQAPAAGVGFGAGAGPAGSQPGQQPASESLLDWAKFAFAQQKEDAGIQYLHGHALVTSGAFDQFPLVWIPAAREPRLAMRWGVGIQYEAPRNFYGRPPTVGDPPPSGPRGGGGVASPYSNADRTRADGALLYYTGEFGEQLLKRLEQRRQAGQYGQILAEMDSQPPARPAAGGGVPAAGGGGGGDGPGGLSFDLPGQQQQQTPAPGAYDAAAGSGTLIPGVMMIGLGRTNQLLDQAEEMGLDALIVFQVSVSQASRGGNISSTTRLRLYAVKEREELHSGPALNYISVYRNRERGADDPVEGALDRLFEVADEHLAGASMPQLNPDIVATRIARLLETAGREPLPVAVEVLYYFQNGLADPQTAGAALTQLLGPGGAVLLTGSEDQKRQAILSLLPDRASLTADARPPDPPGGAGFGSDLPGGGDGVGAGMQIQ